MLVNVMRKTALPALFGLLIALSAYAPATAFADDAPQAPQDTQTEAAAEQPILNPEISTAILDSCNSIASKANANNLLDQALALEGSPYAFGGTTPRGFDCSGFTKYCFKQALGIDLPRTAGGQAALGEAVSMDELQPGDLLFWGHGSGIYHVGIYVGDGSYIHAAGAGKGVRVQTMEYFHPSFAKRVI